MAQSTPYITPPPAGTAPGGDGAALAAESTSGLLRRLGDDLANLLRKELALATAEITESVTQARTGVSAAAAGGGIMLAGFIILLVAASAALALVWPLWLAALVIGAAAVILGLIVFAVGSSKLKARSLRPTRTQEQMRQDREMVRRRTQ